MNERRRTDRYPAELEVDVAVRKDDRRVLTRDVGRHGIFVRMDDPPDERLLVQLKIHLPDGPIPVLGMVVHRVPPERGLPGGAGLQFFATPPDAKDRLDAYIATLRGGRPAIPRRRSFRLAGARPGIEAKVELTPGEDVDLGDIEGSSADERGPSDSGFAPPRDYSTGARGTAPTGVQSPLTSGS